MKEVRRLTSQWTTERGICVTTRPLKEHCPEHWHDYFELEYIISGEGTMYLNDTPYELKPGTLCFFTPLDFEMIEVKEEITLLNIAFTESWVDSDLVHELISPAIIQDYSFPLAERIVQEYNAQLKYNDIVLKNTLNTLLVDVERYIRNYIYPESKKLPVSIRRALLYMRQHFNEDISLETVAKFVYLHPVYFSKIFKDNLHKNFTQYLLEIRLEFAKGLLLNSTYSVTEICFMSGFTSLSHFLRCFKAAYDTSPKKYRLDNRTK